MNILSHSSIDINNLIGALLINENNSEFYCIGIKFSLDNHIILIELSQERNGILYASIPFEDINNNSWSIQF